MKESMIGLLACPVCHAGLEFEGERSRGRLVEGALRCPDGHLYQVKDEIPILKEPRLSMGEFSWEVEFPDIEGYDEIRRRYASFLPDDLNRADRSLIEDLAKSAAHEETVLDVASGMGRLLIALSESIGQREEILGTDVDDTPLRGARLKLEERGRYDRVSLCAMDGKHLALRAGAIPCVTSLFGFDNIPDGVDAFREASTALMPGGRLVMANLWLEEDSKSLVKASEKGYGSVATEDRLRRVLGETGLEVDSIETYYSGRWPHNPMDAFPFEGDWFSHVLVSARKV